MLVWRPQAEELAGVVDHATADVVVACNVVTRHARVKHRNKVFIVGNLAYLLAHFFLAYGERTSAA
jgi:hypothetical protein